MKQTTYTYKSKAAAIAWGIFLGGFGAHRFYLGHAGLAVVILCLTLLMMLTPVWWVMPVCIIVDCIFIASQDKEWFKRESGYTEVQNEAV